MSTDVSVMPVAAHTASTQGVSSTNKHLSARLLVASATRPECKQSHGALRQYFDACNTILSQRSRLISAEWTSERLHHYTDQTLEQWMVGRRIAAIEDGVVVVTLGDRKYQLFNCTIAEMVTVHALRCSFTLACNQDSGIVTIRTLRCADA